jgi:hypothetical protein
MTVVYSIPGGPNTFFVITVDSAGNEWAAAILTEP